MAFSDSSQVTSYSNHGVIRGADLIGLPTTFELLPQQLNKLGYQSHIIGKWHLGFCNEKYLPENRGFDSFYGTYLGALDYYNHCVPTRPQVPCFFNKSSIAENKPGIHLNELILQQTRHVLSKRNPENPIFLYLPFTSPHSPLQAPEKYLKMYEGIHNEPRRIYSAMVTALDDAIGSVISILKETGVYDNSVIVFSSDNGAQVKAGGNNFPLRGGKATFYEGGTRVNTFVHSPLLAERGFVYNGMIHAVDWFSTFLYLAGGKPDTGLDSINIWESLINNENSPREEFVYNIDTYAKIKGAIRVGDLKLMFGEAGLPNECISEENVTAEYGNGISDVVDTGDVPNAPKFRLFNITDDPYEIDDLALKMPLQVMELARKVDFYLKESVKPIFSSKIPRYLEKCCTNLCEAVEKPIPFRKM